jgi:hypothetical protein
MNLENMNDRLLAAGYSPLDEEQAALYQSTNPADADERDAMVEDLEGRVLGVHR